MTEENLLGQVKAPKKNYDLLDVVMVCLGQKKYTELTGLLRLLNMALLDKLNGSEKRRIMATEFNIEITPELEKGVDDMCNLSAGIEKKGIAEGENRLSKLIAHLLKIGRNDEIKAATESEKLRT